MISRSRCAPRCCGVFLLVAAGPATWVWAQLPPPPVPPENPITPAKRVLGKILFWEEQLSSDNSISCGTCHIPANAGADPRIGRHPGLDGALFTPDDKLGSPGVRRADENGVPASDPVFGFDVQVTLRSAQSITISAYAPETLWDGAATSAFVDPETGLTRIAAGGSLESQAVRPILSDVEMAHENRNWGDVAGKLTTVEPLNMAGDIPPDMAGAIAVNPSYLELFEAAFGDPAITAERIAFAIATYERTLVPNQTPWDAFMAGNPAAMTPNQVAGWNAFAGSPCAICHTPPLFTNSSFQNIGLRPIAEDLGRQEVTGNPADRGRFKVPTLRNVGLKETYMHTGQLPNLGVVLDFYAAINGQVQFPNNKSPLLPIPLPPPVRPQVIDFMANGLTDPRVASETFPFDRPRLRSEILAEFAVLQDCMAGPDTPPVPAPPLTSLDCIPFDVDLDGDVDLQDYAAGSES